MCFNYSTNIIIFYDTRQFYGLYFEKSFASSNGPGQVRELVCNSMPLAGH